MNLPQKTEIQKDVTLTQYNTLGLHSVAPVFIDITSVFQLMELGKNGFFDDRLPFILGGGSNILLSDRLSVPVLKISIPGIQIVREDENRVFVKVGAGEDWHGLVTWAVKNGLGGIENLALIPGTAGAAPIQNIGAYGVELESLFESLEAYDLKDQTVRTFDKEECRFGYRDSIFKGELKGRVVVTSVTLQLKRKDHFIQNSYYALKDYLTHQNIQDPGIEDIYRAVIAIRQSKLPNPTEIGNAGSFFKNPVIRKEKYEQLKDQWPEIPGYPDGINDVKVPAAWLIEKAGWKGLRKGNVGTYKTQALVIVNHGGATGKEILDYSKNIQKSVSDLFGVDLIPEVNIIE